MKTSMPSHASCLRKIEMLLSDEVDDLIQAIVPVVTVAASDAQTGRALEITAEIGLIPTLVSARIRTVDAATRRQSHGMNDMHQPKQTLQPVL